MTRLHSSHQLSISPWLVMICQMLYSQHVSAAPEFCRFSQMFFFLNGLRKILQADELIPVLHFTMRLEQVLGINNLLFFRGHIVQNQRYTPYFIYGVQNTVHNTTFPDMLQTDC